MNASHALADGQVLVPKPKIVRTVQKGLDGKNVRAPVPHFGHFSDDQPRFQNTQSFGGVGGGRPNVPDDDKKDDEPPVEKL